MALSKNSVQKCETLKKLHLENEVFSTFHTFIQNSSRILCSIDIPLPEFFEDIGMFSFENHSKVVKKISCVDRLFRNEMHSLNYDFEIQQFATSNNAKKTKQYKILPR